MNMIKDLKVSFSSTERIGYPKKNQLFSEDLDSHINIIITVRLGLP